MSIANICFKTAVLMVLSAPALYADTIYKSVDENGRVTYSTTPPADDLESNIIDITPPPSKENQDAAKQRAEQNSKTAKQIDADRQIRNEASKQENQQRRDNQAQQKMQQDAETNNSNYGYGHPGYPRRRPTPGRQPGRPVVLPSR